MSIGAVEDRPSRLRDIRLPADSIRFRLALLHSILLFGIAAAGEVAPVAVDPAACRFPETHKR